jgi:protein CWC15
MTTAARPTFHPAVGGEDQGYFRMEAGTRQISVKDMPGHTRLKMRREAQKTVSKTREELRAELEDRERASKDSKKGDAGAAGSSAAMPIAAVGAPLQLPSAEVEKDADDIDAANVEVSARARGDVAAFRVGVP